MSAAQTGSDARVQRRRPKRLVGGTLSFVQVMRELDLGRIQRQFAAPVRVLATGSDFQRASRFAEALFGPAGLGGWSVAVARLEDDCAGDDQPDLVVLFAEPTEEPLELVARHRRLLWASTPVLAVQLDAELAHAPFDDPRAPPRFALVAAPADRPDLLARQAAAAALDLRPELALALGRRFPAFRAVVGDRLVRETSWANAQFALLSSLPASVPFIGGIAGGAADLAILTKNQGILVYKLAGLFGRDLEDRLSLAIEIAPVVGGAFIWRSLARTLLGFLPPGVGGLPKAVVAYGGTYAVGQMARYYYSTGRRPPPELVTRFQTEGIRLATELAARLRRRP